MSTASGRTVETEVRSSDGTSIAFEQSGRGPALILVSSALADRSDTRKLAGILAGHFTVINYDRRGRGASSDGAAYAVEREVEDIAALIGHAGGSASVFGSSSGAVLALRAAAAGLDVDRLALYEPPFSVTQDDFGPPEGFAGHIGTLLAEDRRSEAVKAFMVQAQNMPAFMVGSMRLMPGVWRTLTGMAHTLPYDLAVMGDTQRGRPLEPKPWSAVKAPVLVLTGSRSPEGFGRAAQALTEVLPDARHRTLKGLNHGAVVMAPRKIAPEIIEFLGAPPAP
ncbi:MULTISPECIES: alpha/beta fold hydrolase [Streptomyces]|uniref:Alpha-beta hydrolase superfamily lysophospholipase n=1 Tax=Streptomyces clavifer TaxID=68188 RepID=A0ABS4V7N2_9ACTN|nr:MULTISPECIES: alpha/beta fold hydrolase [Streptomyces]MBP2359816.1 alpha-beta hydrolase superfamily lysophospholipase [Streptomyces clavifer]MDX2746636.1 alpha/beta fold hydrolase [Streptomyces sp. NRRL_B-2557]GHB16625.1 alpha/beta hydrolase [Streptomyces clavifer]